MRLRLGCPRTALIVAPHPDDETIGAFGLIRALRRRGTAVRVIVASDGGASHPGSATWPPPRLIAERRRETLRAMRRLGLARGAIGFVGLPDGVVTAPSPPLARALRRMRPDLLVGPDADDGHEDHRAIAAVLRAARLPGVRRLTYRVWPAGSARGLALPLDTATRAAKRSTLRGYRTQAGLIRDAVAGFAMDHRLLRAFTGPRELYREVRR